MSDDTQSIETPPDYCEYAGGPCDQTFAGTPATRGVILYPSDPTEIASTVESAAGQLRKKTFPDHWRTWKQLKTTGQTIFCEICKTMRYSDCIVADVTTLNLNLLFEIGFALGLEQPVIPIRDTTYIRDKRAFEELGMLDTVGYLDFQNSTELAEGILARLPVRPIPTPPTELNRSAPLYVLKGPIETDGALRMLSILKKSPLRFRTYDTLETPRLSLHDARKQVASSFGVVANLLSPERRGSSIHNARAALIAGIALASGRVVLLLHEGHTQQPIDYRDIVRHYTSAAHIETLMTPFIRGVTIRLQAEGPALLRTPSGMLQELDLGDLAAENEILGLRNYFVPTAQYQEARRGHARLVVGRKGSGKTAIFYAIRDSFWNRRSHIVLDLKPEGHQFTKLRDTVLSRLSPGLAEHTMVAFWNYIILCEIAEKIQGEERYARRDPDHLARFETLMKVYRRQVPATPGDFSERLLRKVGVLTERFGEEEVPQTGGEVTNLLFREDIKELDDAVAEYLVERNEIWVLVDNLDKGWPTRGATSEDILVLRSLLEATRKIQRQLQQRGIEFKVLVFLRNDIYEHLLKETRDKGKDTQIVLDWSDPEAFKQLVANRMADSLGTTSDFDALWPRLFASQVGVEESFRYILARTLMRPRDLLNFLHRAVEIAVNRGHDKVSEDDIVAARVVYSEDLLLSTAFELTDVFPDVPDPLYVFLGCPVAMRKEDVVARLSEAGIDDADLEDAVSFLTWFGFLGVRRSGNDEPTFAYQVRYNVDKLMAAVDHQGAHFEVHPAFWDALECTQS